MKFNTINISVPVMSRHKALAELKRFLVESGEYTEEDLPALVLRVTYKGEFNGWFRYKGTWV